MAVNEDGHRHLERTRTGAAQPQHGPDPRCGALKDHEDCDEVWKRKVVVVSWIAVKKPLRSSERR